MSATAHGGGGAHILVFPYPAQGHMLPLLDLTHHLSLHNLTITILVTPKNLPILTPLLTSHPSISTLVLPFPHHHSLPPGVENVKDIGNLGNMPIITALAKLKEPIMQWFRTHDNPPVAIISDFFLGWTQQLADRLGVRRIAFYSSGCFLASVVFSLLPRIKEVGGLSVVELLDLPKKPTFVREHLPTLVRLYRENDPEKEFAKDGMAANASSWGAIFNSFEALERGYLEHLRVKMGHGRVYGVGPVSLMGGLDPMERGKADLGESRGVFEWLDGCPDGSVLYVCFGSQKLMTNAQMEALANGLELSGVRFVWVVKSVTTQQADGGYGSVPEGFEDRVLGRGMVIEGWAPQVPILSHKAVGGFLSHCGWNSLLEGIAAGVLILAWPMEADQYVNAKLLVEYHGAAVRACEGPNTVLDSAELAKIIAESMSGRASEKGRAKEFKGKATEAVGEGGSSRRDLAAFVRELNQLQNQTT